MAFKKEFIAQHFLIGGDWGDENYPHSHHFKLELIVQSDQLDQHGYVIDLVHFENLLNDVLAKYRDKLLNDCEAFQDLNPSIENFCRILSDHLCLDLDVSRLRSLEVKLWEDANAWSSFTKEF